MEIFTRTGRNLQGLLTASAEEIGQRCGLIQRQREFTASSLLSTFVLGFLQHPRPTWERLALVARQCGAHVSPQAVEQRITPALRDSLLELLQAAVGCVVESESRACPLLRNFTQVRIGDSTTIALSDQLADTFPGCGGTGGSAQAAIKFQIVWDYLSGGFRQVSWEAGKQNDSTSSAVQEIPPAGSLSIYDLGYFSLERFREWQDAGAQWISRGISDVLVWIDGKSRDLHEWLAEQLEGAVDQWIEVGTARLPCRIVALRVPPEVEARRRQKAYEKAAKKGRQPSSRHLATCAWTVFLTSCPQDVLNSKEVVVLYRVRWQIELLFKLWKSHNLLDQHRSDDPVRQMVELSARMVAIIIQHWLILATLWTDERLSLIKATRLIRDQLPQLIPIITRLPELIPLLRRWGENLHGLARVAKRRTQPSNPELLANAERLTYCT